MRIKRPKAQRMKCAECGRTRDRKFIEWHPGCEHWQCSPDDKRCSELFQERWDRGIR